MMKVLFCLLLCTLYAQYATTADAADWYVAPQASDTGNGSLSNPWQLAIALNQPSVVQPGDTLWLRGGIYPGKFISRLVGSQASPIIVRQFPGERARLDGGANVSGQTLEVDGSDTWYMDFEVFSSSTDRSSDLASSGPDDLALAWGVNVFGVRVKLINLIVHDVAQNMGFWTPAQDSEAYGNILFNGGWHGPDRGHGHAFYTQNDLGTKHIHDNIMFNSFGYGIHGYTEGGAINNFDIQGNVIFNNGAPEGSFTTNILLGGYKLANQALFKDNYTYFPANGGTAANIGYNAGCTNFTLNGNFFMRAQALSVVNCSNLILDGNTFLGPVSGITAANFPNNSYFTSVPTSAKVILRKNKYDPSRTMLVIYNWQRLTTVSVDVSTALSPGNSFKLLDVQNLFGSALLQGTYAGGNLSIPMTGTVTMQPNGSVPVIPSHTHPEFGVYLLYNTDGTVSGPAAPNNLRLRTGN